MRILSLDSAAGGCAVCVWQDGVVLALAEEKMERGQDARLVPLVQETMDRAGADFASLDRIAVTRGPGSFTGLRIGLATARGLGLAAEKPVIGMDRFAVHRAQQEYSPLLVVLESRRLELYVRFYPVDAPAHEAQMLTPQEIAAFLAAHPDARVAGDADVLLDGAADPSIFLAAKEPEAVTCARLAAWASLDNPEYLPRPLYLRAPDVTIRQAAAQGECHA